MAAGADAGKLQGMEGEGVPQRVRRHAFLSGEGLTSRQSETGGRETNRQSHLKTRVSGQHARRRDGCGDLPESDTTTYMAEDGRHRRVSQLFPCVFELDMKNLPASSEQANPWEQLCSAMRTARNPQRRSSHRLPKEGQLVGVMRTQGSKRTVPVALSWSRALDMIAACCGADEKAV